MVDEILIEDEFVDDDGEVVQPDLDTNNTNDEEDDVDPDDFDEDDYFDDDEEDDAPDYDTDY